VQAAVVSAKVRRRKAEDHYEEVIPIVKDMRANGRLWQEIVDHLNEQGYCTTRGMPYNLATVYRLATKW
jgi:hypothetical protein